METRDSGDNFRTLARLTLPIRFQIPPFVHKAQILEPFAQVDSSLSRGQEGTGLGLALVKVKAELHGGRLRLASEIGQGTTASLSFPLARVELAGIDANLGYRPVATRRRSR